MPKRKSIPTIEQLKEAAKAENWEYVDRELPTAARQRQYVEWAITQGITDRNPNVRDLGASILEKARLSRKRFDAMRNPVASLMQRDEERYSGFRAACALAVHGPGDYRTQVIETLQRFREDEDTGKIAARYLRKLKA